MFSEEEVLTAIRYARAESTDIQRIAKAILRESATKRVHFAPKCQVCGKPTMHMGHLCYACGQQPGEK